MAIRTRRIRWPRAAAIATLDLYKRDKLFDRAASKAEKFESAVHALRDAPYVKDTRTPVSNWSCVKAYRARAYESSSSNASKPACSSIIRAISSRSSRR